MLAAESLTFAHPWGPELLTDLTLTIEPGEIVGLPGPSGRGKSTLGRLMAGYLKPQRGRVVVDGRPLATRGFCPVQMLFQHPETAVNPRWRIRRILEEAGPVDQQWRDALQIHCQWLNRYPHELSGGELQRIALARAMQPGTRFLIADEMTTMLDVNNQALIWNVVVAWARRNRVGILAISHNMHLLDQVTDRIDPVFL